MSALALSSVDSTLLLAADVTEAYYVNGEEIIIYVDYYSTVILDLNVLNFNILCKDDISIFLV